MLTHLLAPSMEPQEGDQLSLRWWACLEDLLVEMRCHVKQKLVTVVKREGTAQCGERGLYSETLISLGGVSACRHWDEALGSSKQSSLAQSFPSEGEGHRATSSSNIATREAKCPWASQSLWWSCCGQQSSCRKCCALGGCFLMPSIVELMSLIFFLFPFPPSPFFILSPFYCDRVSLRSSIWLELTM